MVKSTELRIIELLTEIKNRLSVETDKPLSIVEACEYLHVKKPTLYVLTSKRRIPFSKKSGKLWFRESDLRKWLLSDRKAPVDEIVAGIRERKA